MPTRIRPAKSEEHDALWTIWHDAVAATHHFLDPDDFERIGREVREQALTSVPVDVIVDSMDKPLGFRGMDDHRIEMLFVSPEAHGQGLGRALIAEAADRFGVLELDVNEGNTSGVGFYEHLGFRQIGRSELDDAGRPYPLLHMRWKR